MKTSGLYVVECMENSHRGWENRKRTVRAYTAEDAAFQTSLLIDVHGGEKVVSVEPKDAEESAVTVDQISITGVTPFHTTGFTSLTCDGVSVLKGPDGEPVSAPKVELSAWLPPGVTIPERTEDTRLTGPRLVIGERGKGYWR